MDILIAFILGIIEGATEFLPVSSTAHLVVSEKLFGFKDEVALFTVVIQLGAILSAALYFRHDLRYIFSALVKKDVFMWRFIKNVALGLAPAIIAGLVMEKTVGLPDSPLLIATMLIVGGIVLILVEKFAKIKPNNKNGEVSYGEISVKRSLLVGSAQALAIIPGVSRSGATIVGGLLSGLDRKTATVFSFYLSIPVMIGASTLKIMDNRSALNAVSGGKLSLLVGTLTSFIVGFIVVKWLLQYVQKHTFTPFGYYRIFLGIVIIGLLAAGYL